MVRLHCAGTSRTLQLVVGSVLCALTVAGCVERPARALERAVVEGRIDDVRTMLAEGVDPNALRHPSIPSALAAAAARNREMVQLLLAAGADPNLASSDGYTPLLAAAYFDQPAIVGDLLAAGANVNGAGLGRWTPLTAAARRGHLDCVERLLAAGADPLAGPAPTALELARRHGHTEIEALLARAEQQAAATRSGDAPGDPSTR